MNRKLTANAISLSSITATVRSKGVACPKCLRLLKIRKINLQNILENYITSTQVFVCIDGQKIPDFVRPEIYKYKLIYT